VIGGKNGHKKTGRPRRSNGAFQFYTSVVVKSEDYLRFFFFAFFFFAFLAI
jgi:hypothetical protein